MNDLVTIVVTALLSGGAVGAVASLITSRALARKTSAEVKALDARLPAEVDSVVVQGAESAVLTMKSALESAQERIAQLTKDREDDRRRIRELEARVEDLRLKVDKANAAVSEAQQASSALRVELAQFVQSRSERR